MAVAEHLVARKAEPTAANAASHTPLLLATRQGHLGITEHFLLPGSRVLSGRVSADFCCAAPNPVQIGRFLNMARQASETERTKRDWLRVHILERLERMGRDEL